MPRTVLPKYHGCICQSPQQTNRKHIGMTAAKMPAKTGPK
jgi:hypothetical protein